MTLHFRNHKVESIKASDRRQDDRNIYTSLKFVTYFSRCIGILPLENVANGKDLIRFRWSSLGIMYTFSFIACLALSMVFCTASGFDSGYDMPTIANQVFYAGSLINMILYLRLATVWPTLIRKWCTIDEIMNKKYGYPEGMDTKIRLLSVLYLLLSIGDHALSIANRYYDLKGELKENYTAADYYNRTFPEMFEYVNFRLPLGVYTSVITTHSNLSWAFNDLFIVIISIVLASRFRQVSMKIAAEHERPNLVDFWKGIRKDYDRLSDLCDDVNNEISLNIMLSYFQNVCFILVQLYYSLSYFDDLLEECYFVYSCCYLLFKTGSVSLFAASINDESKAPAKYLNNVPSKFYNLEIKHMLVKISFDNVVLSGCNMFKITRGLILSIATAIVTYELLLIQLTSVLLIDPKSKHPPDIEIP